MFRWLASLLALLTGCAGSLTDQVHDTSARVIEASLDAEQRTLTEADLVELPAPVQRYLHRCGAVGHPLPRNVRLQQTGRIHTEPGAKWMEFHSQQYFAAEPTAFVWYARVDGSRVHVVDQYVDGEGLLRVQLGSLLRLANAEGPTADQGEGLRYLGELVVLPGALASPVVQWEAIDERSARLTLAGTDYSGVLVFDEAGDPLRFEAERYHDEQSLVPWSGTVAGWKEVDGFRVPTELHATWHHPEGDDEYVFIEVHSFEFDATEPFERDGA